jgi:glycosyltransferase involved in cell wall biosynthesis
MGEHRANNARATATSDGVNRFPAGRSSDVRQRTPMDLKTVRVSVLVAVYNEEATVEDAVRAVRQSPFRTEIIVVDDASTDGTGAILDRLRADGVIDQLHRRSVNEGKGSAIRLAIATSTGDIVLIQDADLEYDPNDWPALLQPLIDGRAEACFGSRFLSGPHRVLYFWHSVGNRVLTTFSNMLTNLNLTDMETCYKAIRGDLARRLLPTLRTNRFGFEAEITARLAQSAARIYEVPVSYAGRTYAEGKKINWKDGIAAFWHIARSSLVSRHWRDVFSASEAGVESSNLTRQRNELDQPIRTASTESIAMQG